MHNDLISSADCKTSFLSSGEFVCNCFNLYFMSYKFLLCYSDLINSFKNEIISLNLFSLLLNLSPILPLTSRKEISGIAISILFSLARSNKYPQFLSCAKITEYRKLVSQIRRIFGFFIALDPFQLFQQFRQIL